MNARSLITLFAFITVPALAQQQPAPVVRDPLSRVMSVSGHIDRKPVTIEFAYGRGTSRSGNIATAHPQMMRINGGKWIPYDGSLAWSTALKAQVDALPPAPAPRCMEPPPVQFGPVPAPRCSDDDPGVNDLASNIVYGAESDYQEILYEFSITGDKLTCGERCDQSTGWAMAACAVVTAMNTEIGLVCVIGVQAINSACHWACG